MLKLNVRRTNHVAYKYIFLKLSILGCFYNIKNLQVSSQ